MINKMNKNKLILSYICLLIPFIIYGIYKNGYLLYQNNLITFISMFKPLFFVLISVLITIGIEFIFNKKFSISFNLINMILLAMIISIRTNYIVFIILIIIFDLLFIFIKDKIKMNYVCIFFLIVYIINLIFNVSLLNIAEMNYDYKLSILDVILGRNVGGMSSTSILFSIIAFMILSLSVYYKKYIPIIINSIYLLFSLIFGVLFNDYSLLLNSSVLFGSIFIATLPLYSPYSIKGMIIYSFIIGLFTFILNIFNPYIGIYIAILIASFFIDKFDNLLFKKTQ